MKKLGLLVMPLMSISFLASCGGSTPPPIPDPDPEQYNVTCTDGVTITNKTAIQGERYETKLMTENGVILPEQINKVTINEEVSTNYTYDKKSDTEATFSIDANYVTGPIDVELGLKYLVTVTDGVTLEEGTEVAVLNTEYKTTLTVSNGTVLPNTVTSITINGKSLTTGYNYSLETSSVTKASFSIEAQYVTGPINIELGLGHVYTASIVAGGGEMITLSNLEVNTLEDYETTISFSDETYHNQKLPDAPTSVTSNGNPVAYTYTPNELKRNEATLTIDKSLLTGDVVITLPALVDKTKWYEFSDWWNYCSSSKVNDISIATKNDVGQIVGVEVNGLMHKVRLIDVDHVNATGEDPEAHCTFEFANVITDSNGEVATNWERSDNNQIFPTSSLNILLNSGNSSIFKKLPAGLQGAIKQVNKKVGTGETYTATTYPTKLFPLAHDEVTNPEGLVSEGEGTKYLYYTNGGSLVKNVVDGGSSSYWLRSPYTYEGSAAAWCYTNEFGVKYRVVGVNNFAVAPAFCI